MASYNEFGVNTEKLEGMTDEEIAQLAKEINKKELAKRKSSKKTKETCQEKVVHSDAVTSDPIPSTTSPKDQEGYYTTHEEVNQSSSQEVPQSGSHVPNPTTPTLPLVLGIHDVNSSGHPDDYLPPADEQSRLIRECFTAINNLEHSEHLETEFQSHRGKLDTGVERYNTFERNKDYELVPVSGKRSAILGMGMFSKVYLIQTTKTKKKLCLKRFFRKLFDVKSEDVFHTLKLQIRLNHQHILKFHGLFTELWLDEGDSVNAYFEYADDGTLHDFLKVKSKSMEISLKLVMSFMKQLLEGLQYIQGSKIVHRNFSDKNILVKSVRGEYHLLISGFGYAKTLPKSGFLNPYLDRRSGNIFFFSPERCRNERYNCKSDIWCLAIIFYRMVCNRYPPMLSKSSDILYKVGYECDSAFIGENCDLKNVLEKNLPLESNIVSDICNMWDDITMYLPCYDRGNEGGKRRYDYLNRLLAEEALKEHYRIFEEDSMEKFPTSPIQFPPELDGSQTYSCNRSVSSVSSIMKTSPYSRRKVPGVKHGLAVIINNKKFHDGRIRDGTDIDKLLLEDFFNKNNYEVICFDDLTADKIKETLKQISRQIHKDHNIFVCCILSHGKCLEIEGTDGECVKIAKLTELFSKQRCPLMQDKPKIFIIQACQNISTNPTETTNLNEKTKSGADDELKKTLESTKLIPEKDDFILAMSTLFGFTAFREENEKYNFGSYFITELCRYLNTCNEDFIRVCHRTFAAVRDHMQTAVRTDGATGLSYYDDADISERSEFNQGPGLITSVIRPVFLHLATGKEIDYGYCNP